MNNQDKSQTPFDERTAEPDSAAPSMPDANKKPRSRSNIRLAAWLEVIHQMPRATQFGFSAVACAGVFVLLSGLGARLAPRSDALRSGAPLNAPRSSDVSLDALTRPAMPRPISRALVPGGVAAQNNEQPALSTVASPSPTAIGGDEFETQFPPSETLTEADRARRAERRREERLIAERQLLEDKKRAIELQLEDKQTEEKRRLEDKAIDEQRAAEQKKRYDDWQNEDRQLIEERQRKEEQTRLEEKQRLEAEQHQNDEGHKLAAAP